MHPCVFIASAGGPRPWLLPASSRIPSISMVPLNGKPIIGWQLDELQSLGLDTFVILHAREDASIREYVDKRNRPSAVSVRYVAAEDPQNPRGLAHSLLAGMWRAKAWNLLTDGVLIVLGQTLLHLPPHGLPPFAEDWVLYGLVEEEPTRWCYVDVNAENSVPRFIDKPVARILPDKALIGVYHLTDARLFLDCLDCALNAGPQIGGAFQLSTALQEYVRRGKCISAHPIASNGWLDCGSISGFHRSKRKLLASRSFNSIGVDETIGVLTKRSKSANNWRANTPGMNRCRKRWPA